jgi:hypothetical protein
MKRPNTAVRVISAALLAGAVLGVTGCSSSSDPKPRPMGTSGARSLPVDSSSRAFALEHYRSLVLAEVRAQPDATFVSRPDISIIERADGAVELMAIGEMDIMDKGTRMRKPYSVAWRKSGGAWVPATTLVSAGKVSPQPLRPVSATGPANLRPSTLPGTPANPTAMPPASSGTTPPLSPAGGGGTTTLPPSGGSGSPSLPPP